VNSIIAVIVVGSGAFVGTMFDNLFAFAAQLALTDPARHQRVARAQALGVLALVAIAAGVGSLLTAVPTRWVGLLFVAPWALAWYAWRHRDDPKRPVARRGALTTFTVTLALGGDNIAVWIPLLRAHGVARALGTTAVFAAWEVLFLVAALRLAAHPRVVAWGTRWGSRLIPAVYFALGVLVLVECGTLT
jgi:cadmium resistance protein CadD (predicted permease)